MRITVASGLSLLDLTKLKKKLKIYQIIVHAGNPNSMLEFKTISTTVLQVEPVDFK